MLSLENILANEKEKYVTLKNLSSAVTGIQVCLSKHLPFHIPVTSVEYDLVSQVTYFARFIKFFQYYVL